MTITSKIRPKDGKSHHENDPGGNTATQPSPGVQPTDPHTEKTQGKHDEQQHEQLQKNVSGPAPNAEPLPGTPAGLHSTGSFAGEPADAPKGRRK